MPSVVEFQPEEHLDIFLRVHRTISVRLSHMFAAAGALPPNEARVLTVLSRYPGHRLRMDELAEDLGMTKGATTRIVDRLVASGCVNREPSDVDRRAVFAVVTPKGRGALRHVTHVFRRVFDEVFGAGLSSEELNQMTGLLLRLDQANFAARGTDPTEKLGTSD
jgi:DNA-binding MarR family transcriptional regulator